MQSSIFVCKGISGCGKSSRVFQLLKYFDSIGMELSEFKFTNSEGKEKTVGILVNMLDLVFIGKIYKSGEVERWQGYDTMTKTLDSASGLTKFLTENKDQYSFVIEGAGITDTHRLRPQFLNNVIGFNQIVLQYYSYESQDQYLNRIIYRSGQVPKKDVMWNRNVGFGRDYDRSIKESVGIDNCLVYKDNFDVPIWDFGVKYLISSGLDELIDEFIQYTEEFDYINRNKFENF